MPELLLEQKKIGRIIKMKGDCLTVGRSDENDLVLDDSAVSGRHCMIQVDGVDFKLIDLSSSNGVMVNGRDVEGSHLLADADVIEIGRIRIVFHTRAVPGPRILLSGPDGQEEILALPEKTLAIGRTDANDLVLPRSEISGFHAQIVFEEGVYRLQDLGSTNGSKVNGQVVTSEVLTNGAVIGLDPYQITFLDPEGAGGGVVDSAAAPGAMVSVLSAGANAPAGATGGGKAISVAAIVVGIGILLVLVEAITQRIALSSKPIPEQGLNLLITNPSFEEASRDGSPPGWNVSSDERSRVSLSEDAARIGRICLRVETRSGAAADSSTVYAYKEAIPVDSSKAYTGGFWVRTLERTGLAVASLQWIDMPGGDIVGEDFGRILIGSEKWARIAVSGIPPLSANRARLRFLTLGGKGTLVVDDAGLYEVDQQTVGTLKYEAVLGECRIVMDRRGVFSLITDGGHLIRRGELWVDMGVADARQSFSILASGYPSMDERRFTVRSKFHDPVTDEWMKFEMTVSPESGSARLDYRIWPESGMKPAVLRVKFFVAPEVLAGSGIRTISGGESAVHRQSFTLNGAERMEWGIGKVSVSLDTSSFSRIEMKNDGGRGMRITLTKRLSDIAPGAMFGVGLLVTPVTASQ